MKAIICVGIPASGKSTYAKELCQNNSFIDINRDSIRRSITGESSLEFYYKQPSKILNQREKLVTDIQLDMISQAAALKKNVVVSDTNLNKGRRNHLESLLEKHGYEVEIKVFHITLRDALARDTKREYGVGEDVIYRMHQNFNKEFGDIYKPDYSKPMAFISDIDGTLAFNDGHRGFFDWKKVGNDKPRKNIISIYKGLQDSGIIPLIFSGRDSVCRTETEDWLNKNGITYKALYMRPEGDHRADTIIKKELFELVRYDYNIVSVIDDRPVVVQMWHDLGLEVIAVADQRIHF